MSQPASSGAQTKVLQIFHNPSIEAKDACSSFLNHSSSSPEKWRSSVREKITEIGQTDPQKASLLSQKILFFQGTQKEREIFRSLGIEIPDLFHRERLQGGVLGEGEAGGLLISALKGAVRLLVEGNKKEVKEQGQEQFVKAQVQLPTGEWIEGQHEGGRILSEPKRSFKTMGTKRYHLLAYGQGKFLSKIVRYEGDFVDDLFHDLTGEATYFIEQDTRFTGCFQEGKRSGHGVLEKYNQERGEFYLYYRGIWKDDHPGTGLFFSTDGEEIAEIKDGMMQKQKNSQSPGSPSSNKPASKPLPSQIALEEQAIKDEEAFVQESRLAQSEGLRKRKDHPIQSRAPGSSSKVASSSRGSEDFLRMPSHSSTRSHPSLRRRRPAVSFDPNIPPEKACPLIEKKLSNPHQELSLDESIELLTTCVRYGSERAKKIEGKEAVIVIGNTGAGKSTIVNYFAGCTMELKSPKELGLKGIKKFVVVRSREEGGALDEIMPIGHTKESKTFMPQIETEPDMRFTFCDCPGFLDNRGAEINIANAVNIKNAIIRANSVKVIILINYHSLMADRGRGLSDMLKICSNLFGRSENLKKHASSLLLGITQAPLDLALEDLKEWIVEDTPDVMQTLSERLFLFDPLDRPIVGGWKRNECLKQIQSLPAIENPSTIFKTVLTDSDEKKLLEISEKMGSDIQTALKEKNFQLAASRLQHLQTLSVIEHIIVERLLNQNFYLIGRHFRKTVDNFKEKCNFEHFAAAATLIKELRKALKSFGSDLDEVINLERLGTYYEGMQTRHNDRIEKERIAEEKLAQAQGQIEELIRLLEEQKQSTLEQMESQDKKYSQMRREMGERIESIQNSSEQMREALESEMNERLAKKEEELNLAQSLNQKEVLEEINQEKEKLEAEYRQRLEKTEQEERTLLSEQEAQRAKQEKEMAAEQKKLQERIRAIEAQKAQQSAKLQEQKLAAASVKKGKEPQRPSNVTEKQRYKDTKAVYSELARSSNLKLTLKDTKSLKTLEDWFKANLHVLQGVKKLDLRNNQLTSIPDSLGGLKALEKLWLHENQLTSIPDSLGGLTALELLLLHENQLTTIPDSLGGLKALKVLDLNNNQLTTIPNSLGGLTALTWLNLSNNQLTTIPDSLGGLTALMELYLSNNQLTTIPDSLGGLTALETLSLFENQLTTIPDSLGGLTALMRLSFRNNQLTTIPDSLGGLKALEMLWLNENQLTTIPDS
nr:E3 ubiquitin-protein ligase SlrP [Chlamydiota bacterium]